MTEENIKSFEKLAKGSYYLILDNIVNLSLGALFWIVLAKLIDAAPLGQAMVAVAFATSVIGFAGYGVQVTISKYMSEYNAKGMPQVSRRILSLGIKLALIVSASVAVAIAILSGQIASEAYRDPSMAILLMLAVLTFLPSQTVVSALMGAYQGAHMMKYALLTDSAYQIIRMGVAVFLVLSAFSAFGIILSFAVASIVASVLGYVYFVPRLFRQTSTLPGQASTQDGSEIRGLRQIIKFSGHNYAAVGMKTLTAQIGVLIIGTQNFELAAFYGLSVLIANLVGGILNAVSRAILPTATEQWATGNKGSFGSTLDAGIRLSMLISGIGFVVLFVAPNEVLGLISEQYIEASSALRILVVASIIYSLGAILTSILNAANRAAEVAKIGLSSSGITIALTFILTPFLYIEGAAIAMLVGAVASLALSVISLKLKENLTISPKSTLKPIAAAIAGIVVAFSLELLTSSVILSIGAGLLTYVGISLAWRITTRKELRSIVRIMRKNSPQRQLYESDKKLSSGHARGAVYPKLRNNTSLILRVAVLLAATVLIFGSDLGVVFARGLSFSAGNITNYVLVIPFLILFVLHRKRRVLVATASWQDRQKQFLRIDDVVGAALCTIAALVYLMGSATLYSLEYHLLSLPVFIAGGIMLLFSMQTLRHSFVAVVFLAYLQPPPMDLMAELAADLSWSSAVIVQFMLSSIGFPISLDASFGAPALVMLDENGSRIPFYVGEPSSGTYSIVGLSIFSIFVAYILRGKLWKRALILVAGLPVFFMLNTARIAIIIAIWSTSGEGAAEAFHVVSGMVMSAVGTLVLLFFADLVLKLSVRDLRIPRRDVKCSSCERSLAMDESLCLVCGRLVKPFASRINSRTMARSLLLILISTIVIASQLAALQTTSAAKQSTSLYNLDISKIQGPETTSEFFPNIEGWTLKYAYRDARVEKILNQDASLAYRYSANSTLATTDATGGSPSILAGLQISRTLHTWEGSLLIYPSKFGRPTANVLALENIDITDDKTGRLFVYQKPGSNVTEGVVYWTDKRELRFGSGFESRNVQIILYANMDSLARLGAIDNSQDIENTKRILLSLARPISAHWEEISLTSVSDRTIDAMINRRPYIPLGITVAFAALFSVSILSKSNSRRKSNARLYQQIKVGDEKLVLDAILRTEKSNSYPSTGEAIAQSQPGLSLAAGGKSMLIDMLAQIRNIGLIRGKIQSDSDEPLLVWRPNFRGDKETGRRKILGR